MPSSGAYGFQMAKVAWELGSCFRRMVTDVIQVWLGVLNHPTQGLEQAEPIFRRVLRPLFRSGFHAHRETQDGPNDRFAAGAVIGGQPPNSRWWHGAVTAAPDGLTAQMTGVEGAADVQPGRTQLSTTTQGGIPAAQSIEQTLSTHYCRSRLRGADARAIRPSAAGRILLGSPLVHVGHVSALTGRSRKVLRGSAPSLPCLRCVRGRWKGRRSRRYPLDIRRGKRWLARFQHG